MFSRIKFSYLFTHLYLSLAPFIGFDIAFTKVENMLKQRRDKVVSTLFQRCFDVGHRRCINVVQR